MTKGLRQWEWMAVGHFRSLSRTVMYLAAVVSSRQPEGREGADAAPRQESHRWSWSWHKSLAQVTPTAKWQSSESKNCPSPYTLSPLAKGDRNLEMRLTSSNNLFPSGSTFESSRNASSPTKQISFPSYTKTEKKFGRETPQKKTLGAACPLPGWYLQGRPKWSLARSPSLECPDSPGESESSGSPFSSSLLSLTTWGKQKGTVSKGCHTMLGPWSPAALEDSQVNQREP